MTLKIQRQRLPTMIFALLLLAGGASAKTIMWLGNFFQQGAFGNNASPSSVDSVWIQRTDSSGNQGYAYGARNFQLTKSTAYVDQAVALSPLISWWSIPTWSPNQFRNGTIRLTLSYKMVYGGGAPQVVRNETQEMNGRYSAMPDLVDSCTTAYPGDTVWMFFDLGQYGNSQTRPRCTDHNPYLKLYGTIHLLNPWPGRMAYASWNGKWYPLYAESGRPGWVSTGFYGLPSLNPTQRLVFASADPTSGAAGIQYMDMTGIGVTNSLSPWDFSTLAAPWERWIAPPVDGTNTPKLLTTKPAKATTLMIRRPTWSASALRVTWKGVPGRFIAQSTSFCEWFSITFYAELVPSNILLNHPFQDTVFGSNGLEPAPLDYSTYTRWITVPSNTTADTLWLNTLGTQKSPGATRPTAGEITVCGDKILAFQVYDYKLPGTYFPFSEKTNSDLIKGLVGPALGADGLPTYTGKSMCGNGDPKSTECTNAANGPNNWFKKSANNTTGCLLQPLKLNATTGKYEYSSSDYFPLDTLIKDPAFNEMLPPSQTQSHDFGFCMHAKSTFEYVPGLSFAFRGDDDVWVYIDKKLALDLGGQHGPIAGDINLDKLGLLEGRAYQFDMFYCERHTPGSNILIQTTMNLVPSYDFRFDSTVVTGTSTLKIDLSYIKTEIDGSKCQDDTKQTPIQGKGFFFLQYPDGRTVPIPEPPSPSGLSGVTIAPDLNSIQVDLATIKKDPTLTQRGWYKIVIRFQNDPSQANVKEIPFQIDRGPVDLAADIFDTDGDGKVDSLVVHAPDTIFKSPDLKNIRAVWAKSNGARDSVVVGIGGIRVLPGDTVAVVDWGAASPFQKRSSCPLGGCMGMGLATTIPYLPDSVRNLVKTFREHVAPFADSAFLSFGTGNGPDTLKVWTSEGGIQHPLQAAAPWVQVGSRTVPRNLVVVDAANPAPILGQGRLLVLVLPAGHAIAGGDSVRLAARFSDSLGNSSVGSSVWVPIRFGAQPIRVIARDDDGDGRVDDIEVRLTKSSAGVPVPSGFGMTWNGLSRTAANLPRSADLLSWRGAIGPFALGTAPTAGDAGWLAAGADATTFRAAVEDSVAPVAMSARLIYGFDSGNWDTLEITGSEPLTLLAGTQALVSSDSAGASKAVSSAGALVVGANTLRIAVPPGTIPDDVRWARLGGGISDGHAIVGVSSRWANLVAVPSGRATLFDSDGDGKADSVHLAMRGSLPLAWMAVSWCDASGNALVKNWPVAAHAGSIGVKPADPNGWFPKGATACSHDPSVTFLDPSTGSVLARWPISDAVAPMATHARYAFGPLADTLEVRFSEPVAVARTTPAWVEWKGSAPASVQHDASSLLVGGGTTALMVLKTGFQATDLTDSVRIAAGARSGNLVDLAGTSVGATSPMVPMEWGIPPLSIIVSDPSGHGTGTEVSVRSSRIVPVAAIAGVRSIALRWNGETRDVALAGLAPDPSGGWHGALGAPFSLGSTACGSDCGATSFSLAGSSAAAIVVDSVPPSLISASFRYSKREVSRDTMFFQVSEPWTHLLPPNTLMPLVTVGRSDSPLEVDSIRSWFPTPDGGFGLVVDTTWEGRILRGDSARFSWNGGNPLASDAFDNRVGSQSRWVPIEFGQRPLELVIRQENQMLINGRNGLPAWTEPPQGVPGLEILVRSDKGWVRMDQDLVRDPVSGAVLGGAPPRNDPSRTMGVYIKLNRPLEGTLFVYDNIGISVLQEDLSKLRELWPENSEDLQQEIKLTWNGTGPNGKFAAGGVYLLRTFVKFQDKTGRKEFHNLLWKYAWVLPNN